MKKHVLGGLVAASIAASFASESTTPALTISQEWLIESASDQSPTQVELPAATLVRRGQWSDALPVLVRQRTREPGNKWVIASLGRAYAETGDHENALACWQDLQRLEPGVWTHTAKTVQALHVLRRWAERDAAVERVRREHAQTTDPVLAARTWFCRDQFEHHGARVLVVEYFEPSTPDAELITFIVVDHDGGELRRLSLASLELAARSDGKAGGPTRRGYYLVSGALKDRGLHRFYGGRPAYDHVRASVVSVLEGREQKLKQLIQHEGIRA